MNDRIRVSVTLFASLREAAGTAATEIELPSGSTVGAVWPLLLDRYPTLRGLDGSLAWAVNHRYEKPNRLLDDGDVVAVLPPISGG